MRIFASEYYLECEIHIKFCEYSLLNDILKKIFASIRKSEANIRCNMYFSHQIDYFVCESVRIF
jgi:hypothetical protein